MPAQAPPLLPIFRSRGQAKLLARLFLGANEGAPLRGLARELGLSQSAVHAEADRLERAGLIYSDRIGNMRILHANEGSPYFAPLADLLLRAFGPRALLESRLRRIRGVDRAYLFGSWASRYLGEEGGEPEDVDVVVVGATDVRDVRAAARAVAKEIGREVNPVVVSPAEWERKPSGFVETIRSRPMVELDVAK